MVNPLAEGRYDRQTLITWWDQDAVRDAKVLVVGAGALGNEVVKNLVLLGVGSITVCDMDTVSTSNLSRCVFFREGDEGKLKAPLVAMRAAALNPDTTLISVCEPVQRYGAAWVTHYDLVVGCLDNREARVWINQACRKFGKTWIDGAIEGIRGVVKVFPPTGACYECTLGEVDRQILEKRKACSLLTVGDVAEGKVPTTASTSSVVAGLQTQEAVRLLNGMLSPLSNRGWFLIGESFDTYIVDYSEDEWCPVHENYQDHVTVPVRRAQTLRSVVALVVGANDDWEVHFEDVVVREGRCFDCAVVVPLMRIVTSLTDDDVRCPSCLSALGLDSTNSATTDDPMLECSLGDLGLAPFDVLTIKVPDGATHVSIEMEDS
jgi:adenylyltransferase/sulfurtransferase